jgi:glycine cleavage system H protein
MAAQELRFSKTHEWILVQGDSATLGITDYAQHELGDIVFVELPAVGKVVKAGEVISTVESVKSVSEFYSPVSGTVTDVNRALEDSPGTVNTDPMGEGWILKLRIGDRAEVAKLMTAEAYEKEIGK